MVHGATQLFKVSRRLVSSLINMGRTLRPICVATLRGLTSYSPYHDTVRRPQRAIWVSGSDTIVIGGGDWSDYQF